MDDYTKDPSEWRMSSECTFLGAMTLFQSKNFLVWFPAAGLGHLALEQLLKSAVIQAGCPYPSEETHLDSGALLLLSSPRRGGEGGEALDGNVSNTWQDGGQVVADRNLHPAAALHDRQNRRHLRSGLLAADVDPVLPAQRHGTHRVLRQIVAQLQFRVLQEACELLPQGERVVCRLPQRARR